MGPGGGDAGAGEVAGPYRLAPCRSVPPPGSPCARRSWPFFWFWGWGRWWRRRAVVLAGPAAGPPPPPLALAGLRRTWPAMPAVWEETSLAPLPPPSSWPPPGKRWAKAPQSPPPPLLPRVPCTTPHLWCPPPPPALPGTGPPPGPAPPLSAPPLTTPAGIYLPPADYYLAFARSLAPPWTSLLHWLATLAIKGRPKRGDHDHGNGQPRLEVKP
mmetsp:Transcript_2946/g.4330  ORF Transcript_2946/g.4330 Transcript_2946/m.4330 type:complete len:214 (-) Transcript_2946:422-1063(-)